MYDGTGDTASDGDKRLLRASRLSKIPEHPVWTLTGVPGSLSIRLGEQPLGSFGARVEMGDVHDSISFSLDE
jgi:hypothetical protein